MIRRFRAALALTLLASGAVTAQSTDTTHPPPLFVRRDAYYAAGFTAGLIAVTPFDRWFADYLQGDLQTRQFLRKSSHIVELIAVPGAFIIGGGLYAGGRLSHNRQMAQLGLHGSEAILIGLGVATVLKSAVGRARPYVDRNPRNFQPGRGLREEDYRSFPSGHTLTAFAAAAAVTEETRRFWPGSAWYIAPVMYGGATLVGVSRMYNNKHWASDVIVGAAIGTFSGLKVVKYHADRPDNRIDRWLLGVSIGGGPTGHDMHLYVLPQFGPSGLQRSGAFFANER